jgi:hypothetical protein
VLCTVPTLSGCILPGTSFQGQILLCDVPSSKTLTPGLLAQRGNLAVRDIYPHVVTAWEGPYLCYTYQIPP